MIGGDSPFLITMFALVGLVLGPFVIWKVGLWVAQPLDTAAKRRQRPTQFTIVDFLCLFVLVQVPTALIHTIETGGSTGIDDAVPFVLDGYVWISIGVIWWKCVEIMSRAGIDTPWHRIVLLVFALPITLVGPLLPFFLVVVTSIGMLKFDNPFLLVAALFLSVVGGIAGLFLAAWLTRRIVAESEVGVEVPVDVEEVCEGEPEGAE